MGSVSSSLENLFQPITFTGVSQYSSDFQAILSRSQSIADLPLQALQNEGTNLQSEVSAANTLGTTVGGLTSAVQALGTLGTTGLVANSSDTSVVSAQATGATANATYNITNVTSIATAASESSLQSYADTTTTPVSATGSLNLVVGATTTPITLGAGQNNLNGLENAINNANAGVTAQILTTAGGDYLSVSANSPGENPISLVDDPSGAAGGPTQLLTSQNPGTDTNFDLNGVAISEPNTTISDVVPGMTFTIEGTTSPGQTVSVSLAPDVNQLSSDLQSLVSAYNAVGQEVNGQVGQNAGALSGNPLVWQTRSAMEQLVNYFDPSNSGIHSLADLGISLDQTGTMSFNASTLSSLSSSQITAAFQFLGTATTGLGALANNFDAISDPVTGAVQSLVSEDNTQLTSLSDQMTNMSNTITQNLTALQSQLEAADSSAAQLQSQDSLLESNISALNYTTYGQSTLSNQGL